MNEMTYNEWLEKELNIYKRENKELKEELNTYTPNEVYKIVKENKQLKSDINYHFNLKMEYLLENQKLKQELFDIYKEK